jgi:hypothetical protein
MIAKMEVDVFDVESGANRYDVIVKLVAHARTTGRECWAEFCGTLLKAKPDSTWQSVDAAWTERRRR